MINSPEILKEPLLSNLANIYLLFGDEPLQLLESRQLIIKKITDLNFSHQIFNIDTNVNWEKIIELYHTKSLFAEKTLIEIKLETCKLTAASNAALEKLINNINNDNILLLTAANLTKTEQNLKWVKLISSHGLIIKSWQIKGNKLLSWIKSQFEKQKLQGTIEAYKLLADRNQGNLPQIQQEIFKLALINSNTPITADIIMQNCLQASQFTNYDLVDAIFNQDAPLALTIINTFKNQGGSPVLILWNLCNEIRKMLTISKELETKNLTEIFQKFNIWSLRQPLIRKALNLPKEHWQQALLNAAKVDRAIKGITIASPWEELEKLCLNIINHNFIYTKIEVLAQ